MVVLWVINRLRVVLEGSAVKHVWDISRAYPSPAIAEAVVEDPDISGTGVLFHRAKLEISPLEVKTVRLRLRD